MKRILLFVLLKITEIAGVAFVPYYTGRVFVLIAKPEPPLTIMNYWGFGVLAFGLLIIGIMALAGLALLVQANWELSARILDKLKGRY